MSLSTALNIAQSSLLNTSRQTSVLSRNVMDAGNADYSRRTAVLSSLAPGARVVEIHRATNEQLFRQNLSAISSWYGQGTLYSGAERLGLTVNGVDDATSPAKMLGALQEALQTYSATPSNHLLAENVISAASQVVRTLNDGAAAIQTFRVETDQEIATAVSELNGLLVEFQDANKAVVNAERTGRDPSDALDRRDALLKKISEYVPISTFTRSGNDMVVMTADGTTLFETVPRSIKFEAAASYAAGAAGNKILIDGVPVTMGSGGNTNAAGKIAGLVQLRDDVALTMQSQLDEIARGLIATFAETDPASGGTLPDMPGLFTWSDPSDPLSGAMPPDGVRIAGLAGTIIVNDAFVSNPHFLRDGGANGAGYIASPGGASYAELLISYSNRFDQPMDFDPATGLGSVKSLNGYSADAIGWFQGLRQDASRATESKEAMAVRTAEALSNVTGVNVDMEMSLLLDLEHSYQASARIIAAVDEMMAALLAAVR